MIPSRITNGPSRERGIALIAAVLVVLLSSVLVATFLFTTTGERSMSSNVQIAKASLYAADAGVRALQQDLGNRLNAKIDSCCAAYTGVDSVIRRPGLLFPAPPSAFTVSSTNPNFTAAGTIQYNTGVVGASQQWYEYRFTVASTGTTGLSGQRRVQAQGLLRVTASRNSFTDYLIYTNTHTLADGSSIWFSSNTSFDGRVHTNTGFKFAFRPTFYDLVTSHSSTADFNNNGNGVVTANADNNGTIDQPFFYNGFDRSVPTVPLPTNAYNQQNAALLGDPSRTTAPSNSDINGHCNTGVSGSSTPPNGIYISHDGSGNPVGFYIKGDLSMCKMWADTVSNQQWYQMRQGTTTKTILVTGGGTGVQVWNGSSATGSPAETYVSGSGSSMIGVMYVDGGISDLRGPDRSGSTVLPAISENTKLLIAAKNDVVIQRDITCDSYNNNNNVLGIMSANGSVRIGSSMPNDAYLDAYVMAIGSSAEFTVDSYDTGDPRGTFHLRGGMVAQYYGAFGTFNSRTGSYASGYGRDFKYDRRGLIPPCYPTTTTFSHSTPVARTLSWKEI